MTQGTSELLEKVALAINSGAGLVGSRWNKDGAEEIACVVILQCYNNLRKHGVAFTWYPKRLDRPPGRMGINYPPGLQLCPSCLKTLVEYRNEFSWLT